MVSVNEFAISTANDIHGFKIVPHTTLPLKAKSSENF